MYVESVTAGGPADKAGLLPGDAILKLNGLDVRYAQPTTEMETYLSLCSCTGNGEVPKILD